MHLIIADISEKNCLLYFLEDIVCVFKTHCVCVCVCVCVCERERERERERESMHTARKHLVIFRTNFILNFFILKYSWFIMLYFRCIAKWFSYIYMYIYILQIILYHRLLQDTDILNFLFQKFSNLPRSWKTAAVGSHIPFM